MPAFVRLLLLQATAVLLRGQCFAESHADEQQVLSAGTHSLSGTLSTVSHGSPPAAPSVFEEGLWTCAKWTEPPAPAAIFNKHSVEAAVPLNRAVATAFLRQTDACAQHTKSCQFPQHVPEVIVVGATASLVTPLVAPTVEPGGSLKASSVVGTVANFQDVAAYHPELRVWRHVRVEAAQTESAKIPEPRAGAAIASFQAFARRGASDRSNVTSVTTAYFFSGMDAQAETLFDEFHQLDLVNDATAVFSPVVVAGATRPSPRAGATLTALSDGRLVLIGGATYSSVMVQPSLQEIHVLQTNYRVPPTVKPNEFVGIPPQGARHWVRVAPRTGSGFSRAQKSLVGHSAALWTNRPQEGPSRDFVVVFGGCWTAQATRKCFSDTTVIAMAPATTEGAAVTLLPSSAKTPASREGHTAVMVGPGSMLLYGGCNTEKGVCYDDLHELQLRVVRPKSRNGANTKQFWVDVDGSWTTRRPYDASVAFDAHSSGRNRQIPALFQATGLLLQSRGARQAVTFAGMNCRGVPSSSLAPDSTAAKAETGAASAVVTCRADLQRAPLAHRMWDIDARYGQCVCSSSGSIATAPALLDDVDAYFRFDKHGQATLRPPVVAALSTPVVNLLSSEAARRARAVGDASTAAAALAHWQRAADAGVVASYRKEVATCACDSGFYGSTCNHTCPRACSGHGSCTAAKDHDVCECQPGYSGDSCEHALCPPPWLDCSGHGQCKRMIPAASSSTAIVPVSSLRDLFRCQCDPLFDGETCEKPRCPNLCNGNGICQPISGDVAAKANKSSWRCSCFPGYYGDSCKQLNEDLCPRNCSFPHGRCTTGSGLSAPLFCQCLNGWGGKDCSSNRLCPEPFGTNSTAACSGHGRCAAGTCNCNVGWTGTRCLQRTCPSPASIGLKPRLKLPASNVEVQQNASTGVSSSHVTPCGGHGVCSAQGTCVCDAGWVGAACQSRAGCSGPELNNCNGHGVCLGPNHCSCDSGWSASPDCSVASCPAVYFPPRSATNVSSAGKAVTAAVQRVAKIFADVAREIATPFPPHYHSGLPSAEELSRLQICGGSSRGTCDARTRQCRCKLGFTGQACQSSCKRGPSNPLLANNSASTLCVWNPSGTNSLRQTSSLVGNKTLSDLIPQLQLAWGTVVEVADDKGSRVCGRGLNGSSCSNIAKYQPESSKRIITSRDSPVLLPTPTPSFVSTPKFQEYPCPNNCSQHGDCTATYTRSAVANNVKSGRLFLGVQCRCHAGYAGPDCSDLNGCLAGDVTLQSSPPCSGHGRCQNGQCLCDPGFGGDVCDKSVGCPNMCSNTPLAVAAGMEHICHDGKCYCAPGYRGRACELVDAKSCPSECSGHGVCFNGKCECEPNFSGEDCASLSALARSLVDASCDAIDSSQHSGVACSGHGQCSFGRCVCEQGWRGSRCQDATVREQFGECPLQCSGHGACMMGICFCDAGFSGDGCDQRLGCDGKLHAVNASSSIALTEDCSYNGVCVAGQCHCDKTHQGKLCDEPVVCPLNCSNRGICVPGNKCICISGFGGDDCSQLSGEGSIHDKVCPGNCSNHGTCVLGSCICDRFYNGADCAARVQPRCPAGCSEHGECVNGLCICEPGFSGPACTARVQCSNACHQRGLCHRGSCFCDPGFIGESCAMASQTLSLPAATASSRPSLSLYAAEKLSKSVGCQNACSGHGLCVSGPVDIKGRQTTPPVCMCEPGYGGSMCQLATVGDKSCPNACSGNGICDIGVCRCYPSFRGVSCNVLDTTVYSRTSDNLLSLVCPDDCSGHGTCQFGRRCACDPGYSGPTCADLTADGLRKLSASTQVSRGGPIRKQTNSTKCPRGCSSFGVCTWNPLSQRHFCVCKSGFSGPACAQWGVVACDDEAPSDRRAVVTAGSNFRSSAPLPCSGLGICVNGTCACDDGCVLMSNVILPPCVVAM